MSNSVENAKRFLDSLERFDLSTLIAHSQIEVGSDDWFRTVVHVRSPQPFAEAIRVLPQHDRKRIAEAILSDDPGASVPNDSALAGPSIDGLPALLPELIIQRYTRISVATGGERIQDVNDYYMARQTRLRETCAAAGIEYNNPNDDLWQWYRFYKERHGTYAERRNHVQEMFRKSIASASSRSSIPSAHREPTGWERVDRTLAKARAQLNVAIAEEDFQAIGLLCREVIISLAQAVYDPAVHAPPDGVMPSSTDANRMLEAYVHHVFPGHSYKELRAHARAAMALALNVQHRRTATRQLAALCVEAATSTSAVISIIAGRTD
jgi:hypothetical protein